MLTLIQSLIDLAKSIVGLVKPAQTDTPVTPGVVEDTEPLVKELDK
jgi:hypothetical protein